MRGKQSRYLIIPSAVLAGILMAGCANRQVHGGDTGTTGTMPPDTTLIPGGTNLPPTGTGGPTPAGTGGEPNGGGVVGPGG